ncbi:MAG: outer membrane protein transport protein [Rhizobiaceae bacterium]|nr:outer membrane protein transport protein [Rhizobiaceae bacterium]
MKRSLLLSVAGGGLSILAMAAVANANGFSRGSADTDIIFEEGNFNLRTGATYVSPSRTYTRNANPALVGTDYAADYVVPSLAAKLNITDNLRCAFTMVENTGGDAEYAAPTASGKISEKFDTTELGMTCGARFAVGPGNLWVLGGGFLEDFDYLRLNDYSALGFGDASLALGGKDRGYRVGVAYEVPEIAFRTQLMYRSGTDYGAEGTILSPAGVLALVLRNTGLPDSQNPFITLPPNTKVPVQAVGIGKLPQIVELKAQSGIAPGWLAFGSVKWTNWSVQETLDIRAAKDGFLISRDRYYWTDGWTITGGVGHAFTDDISGAVSLTWDQGVGTGWDIQTDTWTLAAGLTAKDKLGGEIRAGLGVSYLTGGEEKKYAPGRNSAVEDGWGYAASLSYKVKW